MDCLDRTNVVQTLFSKRILEQQLKRYNIIKYNETIDSYKQLSTIFKNSKMRDLHFDQGSFFFLLHSVWADNADVVSLQYAGTGALKTDYTR